MSVRDDYANWIETEIDTLMSEYKDAFGMPCSLGTLCRQEPQWATSRIESLTARNELLEAVYEAAKDAPIMGHIPECDCGDCCVVRELNEALACVQTRQAPDG